MYDVIYCENIVNIRVPGELNDEINIEQMHILEINISRVLILERQTLICYYLIYRLFSYRSLYFRSINKRFC